MDNLDKHILIVRLKEELDSGEDYIYEYTIETIYGYLDSTCLYIILPNTGFIVSIYYNTKTNDTILRTDEKYNVEEFVFLYRLETPEDMLQMYNFPRIIEQNEAWVRSIEILNDFLSYDS